MCGIVGIYNYNNNQKIDKGVLIRARETMIHRGPDDAGLYISADKKIGLGHRRLSIIDLSSTGHQPMSNEDETIWIVFNGEIYNYLEIRFELEKIGHQFKSKTDTEVIIHAYEEWGEDCVRKFNGMWAFALWDNKNQKLFCSRDRFGIKPFYYYHQSGQFIFASEIKTLLEFSFIKIQPNEAKIFEYLAYSFLDTNQETLFKDIFQLKPAHNLIIEKGRIKISRHWDLSSKKEESSRQEIIEKFRWLLQDAIRLRFRSDVPVAILLSGGLDSSAIACLAAKIMPDKQIEVFSASYPGSKWDETSYINLVLKKYPNLKPHFVYPQAKDLEREIEKIIWHQDEPFASTTTLSHWLLMKEIARSGIKVILSGQGADEILAGYYDSFGYYLVELLRKAKLNKFGREIKLLSTNYRLPLNYLILNLFKAILPRKLSNPLRVMLQDKIYTWLNSSFIKKYFWQTIYQKKFKNIFLNCSWRHLTTDSLPRILHYEDRNSMAFSVEERLPFLDYRLVEFIFSLSDEYKINQGLTKVILRDSLKEIVPEEILNRTFKIGFNTPIDQWLQQNNNLVQQTISGSAFLKRKYFKANKIRKMTEFYLKGSQIQNQVVWRIINLELWFKKFLS